MEEKSYWVKLKEILKSHRVKQKVSKVPQGEAEGAIKVPLGEKEPEPEAAEKKHGIPFVFSW